MIPELSEFKLNLNKLIADRYQIDKLVGKGATGKVVRAFDKENNNAVIALKLLKPNLIQDPVALARFKNELLVSNSVRHTNIITLYDFGVVEDKVAYISMEYFEGFPLSQLIADNNGEELVLSKIIDILLEVSKALHCVHSAGFIHRDVKPDNVLIDVNGQVKLADLGLARAFANERRLTGTGEALGTPKYMSPEIILGDPVDYRCDIYSFGIMAYEMATGSCPFSGEIWVEIAGKHVKNSMPSFFGKAEEYPEWFYAFVKKCTEKNRENRYNSFDEIITALKAQGEKSSKKNDKSHFGQRILNKIGLN